MSSSQPTRPQDEPLDITAPERALSVLLIQEDPVLSRALAHTLTAIGYAVTCASDGLEGWEQAQRQNFAVVLADMEMGRLEAHELLAWLEEADPYIECLLFARPEQSATLMETLEAGNVYAFYWKPLTELSVIMRDVARATERRQLRLTQGRLLAEARDAHEELDTLYGRLEQLDKVAAVGQMATSIAHDLEQPLMGLMGYAQYLRARLERKEGEPLTTQQLDCILEYLRDMDGSVRKCHDSVQDVLDYTRLHSDPPGPVVLKDILDKTLALVQHSLAAQGTQLYVFMNKDTPRVLANPSRLQQALLSLILNAQEALGKSGGTLIVTVKCPPETESEARLCVSITDDGPGISATCLPHIFEPFFTTHSRSERMGLGLPIARSIVRGWRGDIEIESAPGRGTTARIFLPLCEQQEMPHPMTPRQFSTSSAEDRPIEEAKAA